MNERTLFMAALEKEDAAQRQAYLDEACAGDAVLRERVEALLRSHEREGQFLDVPAVEQLATAGVTRTETPADAEERPSLGFLTPSDKPGSLGRLEHYEVQAVIGQGGMGIVLRAFDEELHRVVAIKVMAAQLATSATARKRFKREAQAAAAVSHDHIVTIHAVEEAAGLPFIVMQCVSGLSLQERLDRDGPLELTEILRIGMQTAAGLAAAHAQGLVHRDIKPANILLENGVERVRITDFGLARAGADASLTHSGIIAGTPQYMAPEQAQGEAVDGRADLFSLGSVLYAMCTGRAPFRASGTVAVLKRVCEETPTPIRDTNPGIPEWLVVIIDKLHAKDPAERFQSAAEVADLLGRHLAQVQYPSVVGQVANLPPVGQACRLPDVSKAGVSPAPHRSRWVIAAAAAVLLLVAMALTEAGGVTHLAATVIRVLTPEGTLVVESDDPDVKVTIEGDGGLIIKGAGLEEIRLRPGSYRVHADKGGRPIPLDKDLVTVARGGRAIVKVKLESSPPVATANADKGAFVLLGGKGVEERKFDTLAEAVHCASDGDTIEIRGNGPFVSSPINLGRTALTIRAGEGFRPVIKLSPEALQQNTSLLSTNAALVLEGLELHRAQWQGSGEGSTFAVSVVKTPLRAANCRFHAPIYTYHSGVREFRNCEFVSALGYGVGGQLHSGSKLIFENCLHRTGAFSIGFSFDDASLKGTSIQIKRNIFVTRNPPLAWVRNSQLPGRLDPPQNSAPIGVEVSESVFDVPAVVGVEQARDFLEKAAVVAPAEAERALLRLIQWRGERNLFATASTSVTWSADWQPLPSHGPKSLEEWKQFWGGSESDSLEGRIKFQGGNLVTRTGADLDGLTPDDFRLRPDSAGYRAGPDGKDLGADVDLVGPGPAYERWKQTPEYQKWLRELATAGHGGSLADPPPPLAVVPFDTPQAKAHQAAWAAHLGVPVEYTNSVGMKFRLIPPGEFTMGTPSDVAEEIVASHQSMIADHERAAILSEGVPHPVRLTQPFYLGQFEVTRAQYRQFVEAKGYKTDPERNGLGGWSNFDGKWVRRREHVWSTPGQWQLSDDEPACILSWNDSHAFCDWLSEVEGRCYTLPTEAQWEFACRAGTMGPTYAGSEESRSDIAWTSELVGEYDLTRHRPQPVGRKRPNAFGLYDMLGNVWEHCADRYAPGPEQAELRIDPTGPPQGDLRVFRGGAWYRSGSAFARASARGYTEPSDPVVDAGIGFRVAIVGIPRFSAPTQNTPGSPTQP